jgi:hypothetical protein
VFEPTAFTAVLFESGATLSGTVHELENNGRLAGRMLYATVDGLRSGSEISFAKTYEAVMTDYRKPIDYVGQMNADATEIEGVWTVRGGWSGKFLMIRSGRPLEAEWVRERESVPVD